MSYQDFEIDEDMEEACRLGDLMDRGEDDEDPGAFDDLCHPGDEP